MNEQVPWFPSRLRELSSRECLELLRSTEVGRVAFADAFGPVVIPVNHVMSGEDVLIRISPYSSLARGLQAGPAAYEVDEFDAYTQSGWSVLVRGVAAFVSYEELLDVAEKPLPWAEGERRLHVRITPSTITGRRLLAS